MIEMNVCDERNSHRGFDLRKSGCSFVIRNSHTNDLAAGFFKQTNLLHRGLHIARIG